MNHVRQTIGALIAVVFAGPLSFAQHRESFESPHPSWQRGPSDCAVRMLAHRRTFETFRSGSGCELLHYFCGQQGRENLFAQRIPAASIIDELEPSVWVKSTRPGIQLSARLVLPRSAHPETGEPLTARLHGDVYTQVGDWQQLRVADMQTLLKDQVFILRLAFPGARVEREEAYIDMLILNAKTGHGPAQVWIDDLELVGFARTASTVKLASAGNLVAMRPASAGASSVPISPRLMKPVRVHGSVMSVMGRPFFARIIEHNGETFEALKTLGFNTIKLDRPATPLQLEEADRLDLRLVCPPSEKTGLDTHPHILAWLIGERLAEWNLPSAEERAGEIRRKMAQLSPPLVCDVTSAEDSYARISDILLVGHPPIGTSFQLYDLARWVRARQRLIQGNGVCWMSVQTEPAAPQLDQLAAFGADNLDSSCVEPEQIWLQAYHAIIGGARGLCFRSRSRLDSSNAASRLRAEALRALNSELKTIEPWAAAGMPPTPLETADPRVRVSMIKTERSQLLVIMRVSADQQFAVGEHDEPATISFSVHGLPITGRAYRLGPHGLEPLAGQVHRRTEIQLDRVGLVTLVVLTRDPLVVHHLGKAAVRQRPEVTKALIELAQLQLDRTGLVMRRLAARNKALPNAERFLRSAEFLIQTGKRELSTGDTASARRFADRVLNRLRRIRYHHWYQASTELPAAISSPLSTSFDSLPEQWDFAEEMRGCYWTPDLLSGGDFEHPAEQFQAGWSYQRNSIDSTKAVVDFTTQAPRSGRFAMRLDAAAAGPTAPPLLTSRPLSVRSAPLVVARGDLFRIQGWVHVPDLIRASPEGFLIFDSMTGMQLAERVHHTRGWRKFTLYRLAPDSGELRVVFALTGLGEVRLDNVSVSLLKHH